MTLPRARGYHRVILISTRVARLLLVLAVLAPSGAAFAYTPPPLFRKDINLQSATTCKDCHVDITEQWERSAHAKADRIRNHLFGRMLLFSMRETRGATWLACGPCHETTSYVNQDFDKVREVAFEGVACVYCHAITGPGDPKGIPPVTLDLAAYQGTIRVPVPTPAHKSAFSSYITKPQFCGSCHQYSNQHGVAISRTFDEWKESPQGKKGITCQSCHMPGGPGRNSHLGPARPRVADHSFDHAVMQATNPDAATLKLRATRTAGGDSLRVHVLASNRGWGHSMPTGNDQNIALIRIRVTTAAGTIVWDNDPFGEWNVSIFGLLLADEFGTWPAETWNARSIVQDRRIKAGGSAQVRYDVPIANFEGALEVQAQLLFRRGRPESVAAYGVSEDVYGAERLLAEATLEVP